MAVSTAQAQTDFTAAMVGNALLGYNNGYSDSCYDSTDPAPPKWAAIVESASQQGIDRYLKKASAGEDVTGAFMGTLGFKKQRHWYLDGIEQDTKVARDPWAGRIARIEPIATTIGNARPYFRRTWRAVAADGSTLGIYDAYMQGTIGGSRIYDLRLYSAGAAFQPEPMVNFCSRPGDVIKWSEAKAKRAADQAAQLAAKDAARAARNAAR